MIKSLPKWLLLPDIVSNNKQEIMFSHGSQIKAIPTSEDAGRSEALSLLIVDEAAFVRNFDTIWTGIYPTISTGGNVIILSTPNGVGGQYHKLYTEAEAGLNEFNPIKIMWDEHPERGEEWFSQVTANLSKRQIAQEYLCDFAISGETYLDSVTIEWLGGIVTPPRMREGPDNNVWIWKQPLTENEYVISADVARGDAKDYSTFHVIDVNASEVVAEYKGKIRPDKFAELINTYGLRYNKALVCPENNSYGYATILKLQELKYPRLYYRRRKGVYIGDYVPQQTPDVAGFNTNGKTRGTILTKLEEVLRNKQILIKSSRFYEELKVFTWKGGRAEARRGFNDDLVMSMAIGCWLFDASGEYSKHSKMLNDAIFNSFEKKSRAYADTPDNVLQPVGVYGENNNGERGNSEKGNIVKQDVNNTLKRGNIPNDMVWLLE